MRCLHTLDDGHSKPYPYAASRHWASLLVGLLLLLSLTLLPTHAQQPEFTSTAPPALLLLILIDDSSTMNQPERHLNSVTTGGFTRNGSDVPNRAVTDDDFRRYQEVERLITGLHADLLQTHQVAVLRFDSAFGGWLSGSAEQPFIRLGAEGDDAAFVQLREALRTPEAGQQPGDTVDAMAEALSALDRWVTTNAARGALKPVVLLLTDDVPIRNWAESPWNNVTEWRDYNAEFLRQIDSLRGRVQYTGDYCRHNNGSPLLVTLPMGSANWVNDDGTIVEPQGATGGNYFRRLADRSGAQTLRRDSVLLYSNNDLLTFPIDPRFVSLAELESDLRNAFNQMLSEVRCLQAYDISDQLGGTGGDIPFSVSAMHQQVRLLFDIQPPSGLELVAPDGRVITVADAQDWLKLVNTPRTDRFVAWGLNRDGFGAPETWAGEWLIRVDSGFVPNIRLEYEIDMADLSWSLLPLSDSSAPIQMRLSVGTRNLTDDIVIRDLQADVIAADGSERFDAVPFTVRGDAYEARVPFTQPVTYAVEPSLELNASLGDGGRYFRGLRYDLGLPTSGAGSVRPQIERGVVTVNIESPQASGEAWACTDGTQPLRVRLLDDNSEDNSESLYSYADVGVYYVGGGAFPQRIARLSWDLGEFFRGEVLCEDLDAGADQAIEVRAEYANGLSGADSITFSFQPTPVPTIAPTATAFFTPTPSAGIDPGQQIEQFVASDSGQRLGQLLLLLALSGGVLYLFGIYWRSARPLSRIGIEQRTPEGAMKFRPLLAGLRIWLPIRSQVVSDADGNALFRVEAAAAQNAIRIEALAQQLRLASVPLALGEVVLIRDYRISIEDGRTGDVYTVYNYGSAAR
jgi:hypothetical protein